jgi:hydroxypyruvate isomerase
MNASRRQFLSGTAAAAAIPGISAAGQASDEVAVPADFHIRHGRIRQSVMGWCYNPMPVPQLIDLCVATGVPAIEGIDRRFYPEARAKGLEISLVSSHGFAVGPVDRGNHAECAAKLRDAIDTAVKYGAKSVITFTGMSVRGMSDTTAEENCQECWKQVISHAEQNSVTLCLEHLNSRDDSHPMKGHPGYFGDDVDRCLDLVRRMDSPSFRLLFDIYHVQIMHGDVITRLRQYKDWIGHYHTAGVPGRNEIDDTQEIQYAPIMKAIVETGYAGFVGQEFIPLRDKVTSLAQAVRICDV